MKSAMTNTSQAMAISQKSTARRRIPVALCRGVFSTTCSPWEPVALALAFFAGTTVLSTGGFLVLAIFAIPLSIWFKFSGNTKHWLKNNIMLNYIVSEQKPSGNKLLSA